MEYILVTVNMAKTQAGNSYTDTVMPATMMHIVVLWQSWAELGGEHTGFLIGSVLQ